MPDELRERYTMGGRVATAEMFVDDTNGGKGTFYKYTRGDVDGYIAQATRQLGAYRRSRGRPGGELPRDKREWVFAALHEHPLDGMRVAVYGSIDPWVEAVALAHGAKHVTTIEYNRLSFPHPQLDTKTVAECAEGGECTGFDAAFSMSSFDHDGLGRYGDPLDPDGDLKAMDAVWRALRPGGILFLTVPVGPDVVVWNLHRRYGPARLPALLGRWEVLDRVGWDERKLTADANWRQSYEPVFVLRKPQEQQPTDDPPSAGVPAAAGEL